MQQGNTLKKRLQPLL